MVVNHRLVRIHPELAEVVAVVTGVDEVGAIPLRPQRPTPLGRIRSACGGEVVVQPADNIVDGE